MKKSYLIILAAVLLIFLIGSISLKAQMRSMEEESRQTQTGKLFVINITPKDNKLKLYLAGFNMANFSFDKTGVKVFVRKGDKMEPLFVTKKEDYYSIDHDLMRPSDLLIEITHESLQERHDFRLK